MKKTPLASVIALSLVIAVSACTKSSTGRYQMKLISTSKLNAMGVESFEQMKEKEKISTDVHINTFVQCVAGAVTKNVSKQAHDGEWEVVVFDSEQVNAFALPGGKVGVYTGILKVTENQHQLAAIIGHEIAHVTESHSNERLSSNQAGSAILGIADKTLASQGVEGKELWMKGLGLGLQYGVLMPYSRSHESEADIVGQKLMAISGFDPAASIKLWQNMAKLSAGAPPEFLSTHPSNKTRIDDLTKNLASTKALYNKKVTPNCVKPRIK